MNATLRKILEMCLQEKSYDEILKEIPNTEKNIEWIEQIKSILSVIGDTDFTNAPEKHIVNGEVIWLGCCFDAARETRAVKDIVHNFSSFRGSTADELVNIITNSDWSSKYSFARWKKDPSSVAPEARELFENV